MATHNAANVTFFFKYTQKPRAKQVYLLCRGATVYVAVRPNIEKIKTVSYFCTLS